MKMIQVELTRTEWRTNRQNREDRYERHLVTWVPVELKAKLGDIFTLDGKELWEVAQVYPFIPEERDGGSPWTRKK